MSKEFLLKGKDYTGTEQVVKTNTDGSLVIGSTYNSSAPAPASGSQVGLQSDSSGNLKVTLATTIAGEDITNDVLKTEQRFSGVEVEASATTVKTGSGFLHALSILNAGTAWEIDVYDGTSSSGTRIGRIRSATVPTTLILNRTFATGLFIDPVKGTTTGNLHVSYR